jgi:precorrin-2 dehydrogenase/sirohydrochlorin ferrochelatase
MLPIILDPSRVPIALVGRGETLSRRLDWLRAGGAQLLAVYTDAPTSDLDDRLGPALVQRLPTSAELAKVQLAWITGLPHLVAEPLAQTARRLGVLTNVEDVTGECDFHTPAVVRRGDLLLTVSTGAKSPGLAARIRARLEVEYGPEWDDRLEHLARKRTAWRRRPRPLDELAALADAVIDAKGWLAEETRR